MKDFKDIKAIAENYYEKHGGKKISKVREAKDFWVFFGLKDGCVQYGGGGICIDKENGEITSFGLPSKRGFDIIATSEEVSGWEE